jgi:hypothetical protein
MSNYEKAMLIMFGVISLYLSANLMVDLVL